MNNVNTMLTGIKKPHHCESDAVLLCVLLHILYGARAGIEFMDYLFDLIDLYLV